MAERDKYDEAIEYLTEHPGGIQAAWSCPSGYRGGCLFVYCTKDASNRNERRAVCGCLTQVRNGMHGAETPELTAEIRADKSVPASRWNITVESLQHFARWQRKLDALYPGRGKHLEGATT